MSERDGDDGGDDQQRARAPGLLRATLLGTGTSTGVPVATCTCEVCTSSDPKDKRFRCSCLIEVDGLNILIDAGPDFRSQCLQNEIMQLDAVLITHEHFDHVAGLDDLRAFMLRNRASIPVYAAPRTAEMLRHRLNYIFVDRSYPGVPDLRLEEIGESFEVRSRYGGDARLVVETVEAFHGPLPVVGFRMGRFAYLTDVSRLPPSAIEKLQGVDTLVLSALRHEPHPTHFTFDEAAAASRLIGARKAYFIHMTHSILHARDNASLPEGIELGYDGLVMEVAQ